MSLLHFCWEKASTTARIALLWLVLPLVLVTLLGALQKRRKQSKDNHLVENLKKRVAHRLGVDPMDMDAADDDDDDDDDSTTVPDTMGDTPTPINEGAPSVTDPTKTGQDGDASPKGKAHPADGRRILARDDKSHKDAQRDDHTVQTTVSSSSIPTKDDKTSPKKRIAPLDVGDDALDGPPPHTGASPLSAGGLKNRLFAALTSISPRRKESSRPPVQDNPSRGLDVIEEDRGEADEAEEEMVEEPKTAKAEPTPQTRPRVTRMVSFSSDQLPTDRGMASSPHQSPVVAPMDAPIVKSGTWHERLSEHPLHHAQRDSRSILDMLRSDVTRAQSTHDASDEDASVYHKFLDVVMRCRGLNAGTSLSLLVDMVRDEQQGGRLRPHEADILRRLLTTHFGEDVWPQEEEEEKGIASPIAQEGAVPTKRLDFDDPMAPPVVRDPGPQFWKSWTAGKEPWRRLLKTSLGEGRVDGIVEATEEKAKAAWQASLASLLVSTEKTLVEDAADDRAQIASTLDVDHAVAQELRVRLEAVTTEVARAREMDTKDALAEELLTAVAAMGTSDEGFEDGPAGEVSFTDPSSPQGHVEGGNCREDINVENEEEEKDEEEGEIYIVTPAGGLRTKRRLL